MQAATFKLYHCPGTRSVRVKWLLAELIGDQFEVEVVSLYDNQHLHPDYLRKNPNHNVPTLRITISATWCIVTSGLSAPKFST